VSAGKSVATALFLALWAAAAVLALAWQASLGVDAASARVTPGGILYVTRATAIVYGIAALPLALLVSHQLAGARFHPAGPLACGIVLTGAVAWFWSSTGPRGLLGAEFFESSAYDSRLLARAVFALATLLPACVLGWSLARIVAGREQVAARVLSRPEALTLGAVLAVFLLAVPYYHDKGSFGDLANRATGALPDLLYDEAEVHARRLQLLGGSVPVAGMPLDRFLTTIAECKETYRAQMQTPDGMRALLQLNPLANPLLSLGLYDQAEAEIDAMLQQDPRHPRALMDRARLARIRDEDWDATRQLFSEAASAARERAGKPMQVRTLSLYADACYRTQRFQEAEALYREALGIEESAQLHFDLAHVYHRQGRARDGVAELRRAIELQPELEATVMGTLSALLQESADCAPALSVR
jgi:tetratricopeptide (TPR) repeat protein